MLHPDRDVQKLDLELRAEGLVSWFSESISYVYTYIHTAVIVNKRLDVSILYLSLPSPTFL